MPNTEIHVVKEGNRKQRNFGASVSAKNQIIMVETGKATNKIAEAL